MEMNAEMSKSTKGVFFSSLLTASKFMEIQKSKKSNLFLELWWLLKKLDFLVFLAKIGFSLKKKQAFPRKKLVFGKPWILKQTFSKEKLCFWKA